MFIGLQQQALNAWSIDQFSSWLEDIMWTLETEGEKQGDHKQGR